MRLLKLLLVLPMLLPFGFVAAGWYFWTSVPGQESLGMIWMAVGAFVLVAYVAVFGGIAVAAGRKQKVRRDGVPATAIVTGLADTGLLVNHQPQMRLDLEVHPPSGRPYGHSLKSVMPLSLLGQVRPGAILAVHIARDDPNRVVLEEPSRLVIA